MKSTRTLLRWIVASLLVSLALSGGAKVAAAVVSGANTQVGGGGGGGGGSPCTGYKNTDARTATGFHFTIELNPGYQFDSFSASTDPSGNISWTPVYDGLRLYRYDVVVTGLSIANNECLSYTTTSMVSGVDPQHDHTCNQANITDLDYDYPTGPTIVNTGPDWRWTFSNEFITRGPSHPEVFKVVNLDAARTITLGQLVFSQEPTVTADPAERDSFDVNVGGVLAPGESLVVNLTVPLPQFAKTSAIHVTGDMTYTGTGGGSPVDFVVDHQEQFDPLAMPSYSLPGLLALALALALTAGLALAVRRRRTSVEPS